MDNFEKHIRENASVFDEHKADRAKLWANISAEIKNEAPVVYPLWRRPLLRVAAIAVLIVGLALTFGKNALIKDSKQIQFVSKELIEIDMHYKDLVSYQVDLVKKNPNLSEEDKIEFLSFMDELDAEYVLLKQEMQTNLDNEQVLTAIVANYKKRIELIEKLLLQLNESKSNDEDYGYTL